MLNRAVYRFIWKNIAQIMLYEYLPKISGLQKGLNLYLFMRCIALDKKNNYTIFLPYSTMFDLILKILFPQISNGIQGKNLYFIVLGKIFQ